MIKEKRKESIGINISEKNKINAISRTREYCCMNTTNPYALRGKKPKSIFEPSSGGIGTRLNIAKAKFIKTIVDTTVINLSPKYTAPYLSKSPKTRAINRFANIPAAATMTSPHLLLLRLSGLYGTGFAQPIIKPA